MAYFKHQQQLHEVKDLGNGRVEVDGQAQNADLVPLDSFHYLLRQGQAQQSLFVHQSGTRYQIWYRGESYELQSQSRREEGPGPEASDRISAPLTGKVIVLAVTPGQAVSQGATLVVLESMKMETALSAPADATVRAVHCAAGDQVGNGQLLVELTLANDAPPAEEA